MKKTLWLMLGLLLTFPATVPAVPLSPTQVKRVLIRAVPPTWQEKLALIEKQYHQARSNYPNDPLPLWQDSFVFSKDTLTYRDRLITLQKDISKNPALRQYRFMAPIAQDLARLHDKKIATLRAFFQNDPNAPIVQTQRIRPFTLSVQLGQGLSAVEIWIDTPTKKVYLMSDNFYSTAKTKYNLHLY